MNKTHSLGPEKKRTPNADQLINRGLTVSGCLAPCLGVSAFPAGTPHGNAAFVPGLSAFAALFQMQAMTTSPFLTRNGNPLQCSCLENAREQGAWWAAVYGFAQRRTRLKRLSRRSSSSSTLGRAQYFKEELIKIPKENIKRNGKQFPHPFIKKVKKSSWHWLMASCMPGPVQRPLQKWEEELSSLLWRGRTEGPGELLLAQHAALVRLRWEQWLFDSATHAWKKKKDIAKKKWFIFMCQRGWLSLKFSLRFSHSGWHFYGQVAWVFCPCLHQ